MYILNFNLGHYIQLINKYLMYRYVICIQILYNHSNQVVICSVRVGCENLWGHPFLRSAHRQKSLGFPVMVWFSSQPNLIAIDCVLHCTVVERVIQIFLSNYYFLFFSSSLFPPWAALQYRVTSMYRNDFKSSLWGHGLIQTKLALLKKIA